MKRFLAVLLSVVMVASVASCGSNSGSSSQQNPQAAEKKTVTIWRGVGTEGEEKLYNQEISDFNAQSKNTTVKYETFPYNDFGTTIRSAAATNSLPEMLYMDGTEVANNAFSGTIVPITQYFDESFKSKFAASAFSYYKKELYGVAQQDGGLAFWANKSMLDSAKVRIPTYEKPWTKDEFVSALEALKKVDGVDYPLDMEAANGGGYIIYAWQPFIVSFGGDWYKKDTVTAAGALDSDATVGAVNFLKDLAQKGYWNAKETATDSFIKKQAALDLTGHWNYPSYKKALGGDLILVPLPDFGNGSQTAVGGLPFTVTSVAKQKGTMQNCADFIKFALGDSYQSALNDANGSLPVNKSILSSLAVFKEGGDLHLYAQQLAGGRFGVRPPSPAFPTFQQEVGTAVQNALAGADTKTELSSAAQKIDKVIADNHYNQ